MTLTLHKEPTAANPTPNAPASSTPNIGSTSTMLPGIPAPAQATVVPGPSGGPVRRGRSAPPATKPGAPAATPGTPAGDEYRGHQEGSLCSHWQPLGREEEGSSRGRREGGYTNRVYWHCDAQPRRGSKHEIANYAQVWRKQLAYAQLTRRRCSNRSWLLTELSTVRTVLNTSDRAHTLR